ncbi:Fc.00g088530.m01.CDS01 [Cosmosporella sp. VM-42]
MLSRFLVLLPLVLSVVAFVLTTLALFAGHKDGFMEGYAVARLNTSMLGHNMLDLDGDDSSNDDDGDDGGLLDKIGDKWDDVKDDIEGELNNITGNIADELAKTLGISEWYSLHVMDACEGTYKPNASSPGAGLNTTNCTDSKPNYHFNLTEILNHELEVGPFSLNLADINWPDDIQDSIDTLNDALLGLFILYVLGVAFSGLAMLGCFIGFFLAGQRSIVWINILSTLLAALAITISSILVTVAAKKGVDKINDIGDDVGVSASTGKKFLAITWVSASCMIVSAIYWVTHLCLIRREKKRQWKPRKGEY